jgi:hypothetical protein
VKGDALVRDIAARLRAHGPAALPRAPGNPSKFVPPGGFPVRVHAWEDYDTDTEKRWWMCGRAETQDIPPGGGRAQRAVLTQDFDDRQGDPKTAYRAVIFNPVPGPPVGEKTRLRFKYKLTGSDTLRVQLYSLTNNYHRYLSVSGVEQGRWLDAAVDMTAMRRPDGTGGPRAELLIDDVVLYEAAADGERRPFPRRVLFTGLFDTGQPGTHWPGTFEIVNHDRPRAWKAAKSVPGPDGRPQLVVGLRGPRRLDPATELTFRYRFTGRGEVAVTLADGAKGGAAARFEPRAGEWAEATLRFAPGAGAQADAITFALPAGSELVIDDVLLVTPGG